MRRLASLLITLLPAQALADSIPTNPRDIPLFWGMLNQSPTYHDAAFKAQEAFLVQTGIMAQYNAIVGYLSGKATNVAQKVQNEVATAIDENTPLNSKHVFFAVATGYTVFVNKELTQKFRNPVFRRVQHTVTIAQDRGAITVEIPL